MSKSIRQVYMLVAACCLLAACKRAEKPSPPAGDRTANILTPANILKDEPPIPLVQLADAPTEDGFRDQGSEEGNRPLFDDFSWRVFVALNWPSRDAVRGLPDKTRKFGDATVSKVVWESWKSGHEIVPEDPILHPPTPWDAFEKDQTKSLSSVSKLGDFHQAGFGVLLPPLIAQDGTLTRYELHVNKPQYDEIFSKRLFLGTELDKLNEPVELPAGSIVVKAAWRELPNEARVIERFYSRPALLLDWDTEGRPKPRKAVVGLVGLHIVTKTPTRTHWIWSTFEHVDNTKLTAGGVPPASFSSRAEGWAFGDPGTNLPLPNWRTAIVRGKPIPTGLPPTEVARKPESDSPPSTLATNERYQGHPEIKNTVWRHYRLVRTQWPILLANGENAGASPSGSVSNATMETYAQGVGCMRCHEAADRVHFVWFLEMRAFRAPGLESRFGDPRKKLKDILAANGVLLQ